MKLGVLGTVLKITNNAFSRTRFWCFAAHEAAVIECILNLEKYPNN
jgi:hypothetical protein